MSLATTAIKRHNHRIHLCLPNKKEELLRHLLDQNSGKSTLIVHNSASTPIEPLDQTDLTLCDDADLATLKAKTFDLVISLDVPSSADVYMTRLSFATNTALILAYEQEEQSLYPIEIALGRTILREAITGLSPEPVIAATPAVKEEKRAYNKDEKRTYLTKKSPDKRSSHKSSTDKKYDDKKPFAKKTTVNNSQRSTPKRPPRIFKIPSTSPTKAS